MRPPTQTPGSSKPTEPKPSARLREDREYNTAILWARQAATYGAAQTDLSQAQDPGTKDSEEKQSQTQPTGVPTHLSRPETQAAITQMAMNSQGVTRNLKAKSYAAAIVAAHLAASRLRDEVDQWHSDAGPRPWNWQVRTASLREQSDPLDPHLRVTHATISPDGTTLKLSAPAWLCENCNNMSICAYCPCFHWPEPSPQQSTDTQDQMLNSPRVQLQTPAPKPGVPMPNDGPKEDPQDQHKTPLSPHMWDTLRGFITEYDSYNHLAERKCLDARDIRLIAQQYKVLEAQVSGVFTWCIRNSRLPDHPQTTETLTGPEPKP